MERLVVLAAVVTEAEPALEMLDVASRGDDDDPEPNKLEKDGYGVVSVCTSADGGPLSGLGSLLLLR